MGKRELLLVVGFIVAGVLAYQFTAPPGDPGRRGFSFHDLFTNVGREMRGNPASVTITRTETIPVTAALTELRVSGVTNGRLDVVGEARADITYEMHIESNGPDDATARSFAERVAVKRDDLGSSLTLRIIYPREGRQRATMVMRVPERLTLRLDTGTIDVSHVAAVNLEGGIGDAKIRDIAQAVAGTHRNGALTIADVGSASLTLVASRATLTGVRGTVTLNARNGECVVDGALGAVEIDETNEEITVRNSAATVRVTGSNGRIAVERPRAEVRVDARRAEVEVTLAAAVPVTALTTDDTLRLLLEGPPSVVVDATATDGGKVQASEFDLSVPAGDGDQHLTHAFGSANGARVALRNQHGEIVIRKAK